MPAEIRVVEISFDTEDFQYRTPIKFGGVALDRATILNVACVVRASDGRTAGGRGSMPLGNVWAWPSKVVGYDSTLGAMKALSEDIAHDILAYSDCGHPVDVAIELEKDARRNAEHAGKTPGPVHGPTDPRFVRVPAT